MRLAMTLPHRKPIAKSGRQRSRASGVYTTLTDDSGNSASDILSLVSLSSVKAPWLLTLQQKDYIFILTGRLLSKVEEKAFSLFSQLALDRHPS